jgi:hypothetical protein
MEATAAAGLPGTEKTMSIDLNDDADKKVIELIGHETTDTEAGPVVRFAVSLLIVTLGIAALVIGFYKYLDTRESREKAGKYPMAETVERPLPPAPRLQNYPFQDVQQLRSEDVRLLERYAWVDKNGGVVRIPIERAIDVLAERGLPHRAAAPATTPAEGPGAAAREPSASPPSRPPAAPDAPSSEPKH